jgi:endonuclease/exonuclease/phosphatase family metal-dependent hydrolase
MRLLTWNICCLPRQLNLYHNPNNVIDKIIEKILSYNPDIINLQEVFDKRIHTNVVNTLIKNKYNVHTSEWNKGNYISKNGLLTATKYNIIKKQEYDYVNKTSVEYMISKGILTTHINTPHNKDLYIHNTHIQSNSMIGFLKRCKMIRDKQFIECFDYFKNNFNDDKKHIFAGDFNDDFDDASLNEMIKNLKMKKNENKEITFPGIKQQLDYILTNLDCNTNFIVDETKLSDHYIAVMDFEINVNIEYNVNKNEENL